MEKPRGRIPLMLHPDIFCLILKGKLLLTVKSISNQDWNLFYDHGWWTPYCWSHKWCHISAVLWLPTFRPEMPILIENFDLKNKVASADSEAPWGAEASLASCSAPSCPSGKALPKDKPTIYTVKASLMWELRRGLELAFGDEGMPPIWVQHNLKVPCALQTQLDWYWEVHCLISLPLSLSKTAHALNQHCLVWLCYYFCLAWAGPRIPQRQVYFASESLNQIPEDEFYQGFHILEWLKSTETFATFLFMLPHLVNTCQWLGRLHCKVIFYTFQSAALFRHVSKLSQVLRIKHEPQVSS